MQRCNFRKCKNYRGSVSYPEKVAPLHPSKLAMCKESVSTFADLSVTLGAAPRHVQNSFFTSEISRLFWRHGGPSLVRGPGCQLRSCYDLRLMFVA